MVASKKVPKTNLTGVVQTNGVLLYTLIEDVADSPCRGLQDGITLDEFEDFVIGDTGIGFARCRFNQFFVKTKGRSVVPHIDSIIIDFDLRHNYWEIPMDYNGSDRPTVVRHSREV